jgi:hypothetical protein
MLNFSVIIRGFVTILFSVFIIILGNLRELPVSLFIIFQNYLFLDEKLNLSASPVLASFITFQKIKL